MIVESGRIGGSLVTAAEAVKCQKDLFAFPGRASDARSEGCNELIRTRQAVLITEAKQLLDIMGWQTTKKTPPPIQQEIFTPLSDNEKTVLNVIKAKQPAPFDEIRVLSNLGHSTTTTAILNLELQGLIVPLPGKYYKLA